MSSRESQVQNKGAAHATRAPLPAGLLQRKCDCGNHTIAGGECSACGKDRAISLQRSAISRYVDGPNDNSVPPIVHEVLHSPGQALDTQTRAFMEPRFGHDFSRVRVHTGGRAAESARAVNAHAYTVGRDVVFGSKQYSPATSAGQRLIAHELAHVAQQDLSPAAGVGIDNATDSSASEHNADMAADAALAGRSVGIIMRSASTLRRRATPYIKKVSVHLTPPQSADLEWEGTPPADAVGSDHFTVSTGKGYSNPGDPAGTCTRTCCSDPLTQCAPPWNQPTRVGACCTFYGNTFWTGTPQVDHNGWQWWTPIQPHYSSRGIALHQHTEVTGQPIGHGCVRMDEPNAKRIFDYSNGRRTNVTTDGRAAPVDCDASRLCNQTGASGRGSSESAGSGQGGEVAQGVQQPVAGLEGVMS